MPSASRLALLLMTCVVAGCGHRAAQSGEASQKRTSIVLKATQRAATGPLPANVCYVASRRYEVQIMVRSELSAGYCDRLASRYLPGEPHLRWPPPYLRNADATPSLVCVLGRGNDLLELDYGPADTGRIDADAICGRLRADGWKPHSVWETPLSG